MIVLLFLRGFTPESDVAPKAVELHFGKRGRALSSNMAFYFGIQLTSGVCIVVRLRDSEGYMIPFVKAACGY